MENELTSQQVEAKRYNITGIETITVSIIDNLLNLIKKTASENFYIRCTSILTKAGLLGTYLAAIIGVLLSVYLAIKTNSFQIFLMGSGWLLSCIILHYIASKFLPRCSNMLKQSPTKLSSAGILDCMSLVFILSGIGASLYCIIIAIQTKNPIFLCYCIGSIILSFFLTLCALHPTIVNTQIDEHAKTGEEAIGLLSFILKSLLAIVPIFFSCWIYIGIVIGISAVFQSGFSILAYVILAGTCVLSALALPFTAFIIYLLYFLLIDTLSAILSIPSFSQNKQ